jgi:hypothetical protein
MEKPLYEKISEDEYLHGLQQRLFANQVEAQMWYSFRESSWTARDMGGFALETTVCVHFIAPVKGGEEVRFVEVYSDGQLAITELSGVLDAEGLMFDPSDPSFEGYLIGYPGYPDLPASNLVERINAYSILH